MDRQHKIKRQPDSSWPELAAQCAITAGVSSVGKTLRRGDNIEIDLGAPGGRRDEITKRLRAAKAEKNKRFERELAFQIRARGLPEPEREFFFAREIKRRFRADFAWPDFRLLVEVQGGIWQRGGGGHSHPIHIEKDIERQQIAVLLGWYLMPVTTDQVKNGEAIEMTMRVLHAKGWRPPE